MPAGGSRWNQHAVFLSAAPVTDRAHWYPQNEYVFIFPVSAFCLAESVHAIPNGYQHCSSVAISMTKCCESSLVATCRVLILVADYFCINSERVWRRWLRRCLLSA
eukprot:6171883-Pleurochrysis_carterae.AAC.2